MKESYTYICDNTNVKWVKIFQLYKGFYRKQTTVGFFTKGSCRIVEPPRHEYKGYKYKFSIKGDISKQLLVRASKTSTCLSKKTISLKMNESITVKKKSEPKSKFLLGPALKTSKRNRVNSLFTIVL